MRRTSASLCLLVFFASCAPWLSGCGSDDAASQPAPGDLEGRLRADTGVTWLIDRDDAGAPMILTAISSPPPIAAKTPRDQATIAFLQGYADVFGVGKLADELVLLAEYDDSLAPGAHHLRFAQRIPGTDVRVFGADLFAHFDAAGALRFAEVGFVREISKISPSPANSADDARNAASASIRARAPQARIRGAQKAPELVVYRASDGHGRLAWRIFLEAMVNGELELPEFFVDAANLAILSERESMAEVGRAADVPNAYASRKCAYGQPPKVSTITYDDDFSGALFPKTNRLSRPEDATHSAIVTDRLVTPGLLNDEDIYITAPIVSSNSDDWDAPVDPEQGRGAAVSTHENLAKADAFFRTLDQKGWGFGAPGGTVRGVVHAWNWDRAKAKAPVPVFVRNDFSAHYNIGADTIFFGDGDACSLLPAGVALDIVTHEYTHAVTEHTAHFGAFGEAGALREAVGDVLGASADHWAGKTDGDAFTMGEDAYLDNGGLRDLRVPSRFASRFPEEKVIVPSTYRGLLPTTPAVRDNDYGHVHDNAVMIGHAFYLMTKGGKNAVSHIEVRDPLDWQIATEIWYRTIHFLDNRYTDTFRHFARVNADRAFMTFQPHIFTAVVCAWRAIEVFTDADLKAYGVACAGSPANGGPAPPAPPPGDCAGHGDNLVCSSFVPALATVCKSGLPVANAFCADPGQRCKQRAPDDRTAIVGPDGALACE